MDEFEKWLEEKDRSSRNADRSLAYALSLMTYRSMTCKMEECDLFHDGEERGKTYLCSHCGEFTNELPNYCPNCGRKVY